MFWNNVKIAIRNIRKHKGYAAINIVGLAIGLSIYVFGGLLVKYEETHDAFFENAANIYTIGADMSPAQDVGTDFLNSQFSAVGPLIDAEIADVELTARTVASEFLLTVGAEGFYHSLFFADPTMLQIFDFEYIHGDTTALDSPNSILMSESAAIKYFGKTDVVGEVVTLDNEFEFFVSAVIRDVPSNSHFSSMPIFDRAFDVVASISALNRLRDYPLEGDWDNLSLGNMTYALLPDHLDAAWLESQLTGIYDRHATQDTREVIEAITARPLQHANLAIWETFGMPMVTIVKFLSFLVLLVACVNYTNLATAQSLGRSREVGMRKTMGAEPRQLLTQFLVESMVIATIAMVITLAALEIIVPVFNASSGKIMALNYLQTLPWLIGTTLLVGLLAGLYPAWLITRTNPIEALRDIARKGKKGSLMRSFMIGAQFAISAFMLALVAIVYMQNEKIKESSYIFPRSEIYTVGRLNIDSIQDRLDTLKLELESLPNVDSVSYSSQVPYEQNNSTRSISSQQGDEAGKITVNLLRMSPDFLETYDVPLLAGRNVSRDINNDIYTDESETLNVLVNELTLDRLGIASPEDAINQRFFSLDEFEETLRDFIIVGVVPTQNILGLFNSEKPWIYYNAPESMRMGSIRITGGNIIDTVESIEDAWDEVIPDYPIQGRFLDDTFDDVYSILKYMNMALAGFAGVALALALIGLFGLAAFMAAQRTKEIGVRKVLGANTLQIARLLVWQFSKPVMWALAIALPAAYFASKTYLDFFADRIETPFPILAAAGAIAVMLAWGTVAGHAIRIARSNPILALRYE
jgi:putative ABC transport system permease protein